MRKNILIFGHGYATQFIDISNQYTRLFDRNHYSVTVVYLTGEPNEEVRQKHLADEVIFLHASKRTTRGLKIAAILKMAKLQRKKQFQLVVCHRYKPTFIMLWVARFLRIPILISVMHEFNTMQALTRKLTVACLSQNNFIMAGVSDAVRDDLRRDVWRVPKSRIITLYNMIDIELTEPALKNKHEARNDLHLANDAFVFGTIGRLAIAKDQQTLLQAFAKIKPHCPNAKLIIMGDGELDKPLRETISQLGITSDVIMSGFVPNAFQYMRAFDVFVLPSIKEAFGRVLLEAMIAKIPILATKINGIPEVVGDAGILTEAKNVEALAKKMLAIYQMPPIELTQLGERGYQRVTHEFSIQRFHDVFWKMPILQ